MTSDLIELIRKRARAIWEREGRPRGRYEKYWQMAAREITQEIERMKGVRTPTPAEEIEVPIMARSDSLRRPEPIEYSLAPRTRPNSKGVPRKNGAFRR